MIFSPPHNCRRLIERAVSRRIRADVRLPNARKMWLPLASVEKLFSVVEEAGRLGEGKEGK